MKAEYICLCCGEPIPKQARGLMIRVVFDEGDRWVAFVHDHCVEEFDSRLYGEDLTPSINVNLC